MALPPLCNGARRFQTSARRVVAAVATVAQFRQIAVDEPGVSTSSPISTALRRACFRHARKVFKAFREASPGWNAASLTRAAFCAVHRGMCYALRCNAIIELWQRVTEESRLARVEESAKNRSHPPKETPQPVSCKEEATLGDVFGQMQQLIQRIKSDPDPNGELRRFSVMAGRLESTFARLANATELLNACGALDSLLEKDVRMAHALLRRLSSHGFQLECDVDQPKELLEKFERALATREARANAEDEPVQAEALPNVIHRESGEQQPLPSLQAEKESLPEFVPPVVELYCEPPVQSRVATSSPAAIVEEDALCMRREPEPQKTDTPAATALDSLPQKVVCSVADLAPLCLDLLSKPLADSCEPACSASTFDSHISGADRYQAAITLTTEVEVKCVLPLPVPSPSPVRSIAVASPDGGSNVPACVSPFGNVSALTTLLPSGPPEDDLLQTASAALEQRQGTPELTHKTPRGGVLHHATIVTPASAAWSELEGEECRELSGMWHRCNFIPAPRSFDHSGAAMRAHCPTSPKSPPSHAVRLQRRSVGLRPMTAEAVVDARRRASNASSETPISLPLGFSSSAICQHENMVQKAMARLTSPRASAVSSRRPSITNRVSSPLSGVSSVESLDAVVASDASPSRAYPTLVRDSGEHSNSPRVANHASRLWTPIRKFWPAGDNEQDPGRTSWPRNDASARAASSHEPSALLARRNRKLPAMVGARVTD